jgi:hypothetical protein
LNPFTVDWEPEASDELALLWMQATNRRSVTDAQAAADRLLMADPEGNGRLLSEGLYLLLIPPLGVFYEIDLDHRHVKVTWVATTV